MNLDELLKSIREEGKKESALSPNSSTVNTEDEKLVEEVIDPKVLEILGIDFTGDLTYGEYKTILKEKMDLLKEWVVKLIVVLLKQSLKNLRE